MRRYFLWLIAIFGLIILVIILFFHHGKTTPSNQLTPSKLLTYASTDAEVRFTTVGPVVANPNHQSTQITVSRNNVTQAQITGYQGQVTQLNSYSNNQASFEVFLRALNVAGFTDGNPTSTLKDERGYCPTGNTYIVELINNGSDVERYWATDCGNPKTYLGNLGLTQTLFNAQVPTPTPKS